MRKLLKSCLLIFVAICVSLSFVGCKKKVSPTSASIENIKDSNGQTTNGGMTLVYGDYLYFINGTKDNDGKSQKNNTRSSICRVKYNMTTGETVGDIEVVVDELVGFADGSIHIFGDYLYYTTPSDGENSKGEILYNKTAFKRYDLVNNKSYTLYTTALNSADEVMNFAYYVVGDTLNLLVYEKTNATINSLKIDKKVTVNYTINKVASCLFSENYGKVITTGAEVDANSFVYYTQAPDLYESPQTGVKIYKTSPVENNSTLISKGRDISLVTIRSGKLIYSCNSYIYAQMITAKADETLVTDNSNCISHASLDNAIYLENYSLIDDPQNAGKKQLVKSEGSIAILSLTKATDSAFYFNIFEWTESSNSFKDNYAEIAVLKSAKDFSFIGLANVTETEKNEDSDTEESKEVLYAVFMESNIVYKIKIAEVVDANTMKVSEYSTKIQLSKTAVNKNEGLLIPEIIGNYLFILSEDADKNDYLVKIDVTPKKDVTDEAGKFALEEKK